MEFCQALPVDLAIAALKLRRGKMLLIHSDSETIAEQEPWWTYALFTAGLLVNHQQWQNNYRIELYKNVNERLGNWHPISGRLYELDTFYKIIPGPSNLQIDPKLCQAMAIGRVLPTIGLRWLSSYSSNFPIWLKVIQISIQNTADNPLMQLLYQAAISIDSHLLKTATVVETNAQVSSHDLQDATLKNSFDSTQKEILGLLNEWLFIQARDKALLSESKTPRFLRTHQGMLLTEEVLEEFYKELRTALFCWFLAKCAKKVLFLINPL